MAIRYDQKFNREIARVVANFNKKVRRLDQLGHALLPDPVLVSDLKKEYSKRSDLKRALRDLQKFGERGSEQIIEVGELTTTRYQFALDKRRAARAARNLTRQIKEVEKIESPTRGLKSDYLTNLQYRRNYLKLKIQNLTNSQLKTREKIISQDENLSTKNEAFYNNYFKMLFRSAYQAGISQDKMVPLLNKLKQFSPYQLAQAVETHGVFKDFLDRYGIFTGVGEGSEETKTGLERSIDNLLAAIPGVLNYYS